MKLIALPDLHEGGINYLPRIATELNAADLIVLAGDLTHNGNTSDTKNVIQAVRAFNPRIIAVPGNWDGPAVVACLTELGINLHRQHRVIDGVTFIGVGGALTSYGQTPTEFTERAFQTYLAEASAGIDLQLPSILISHQPPFETLNDTAWSGIHLGSHSVRTFIETIQPCLCLTGHIHEGVGIDTIGATQIINPGPLWQGGYAWVELSSHGVSTAQIRHIQLE